MEPAIEHRSNSGIRSELNWGRVTAWSAFLTLILFLVANRHGCWLFRHQPRDLVLFVWPFASLVVFLAIRAKWRLVFLVVTTPVVVLLTGFGMNGLAESNARAESAAVTALHQMQSSLHRHHEEQGQQEYPYTMPTVKLSSIADKLYHFEYVPNRSPDGKILSYIVQATPTRRDCGFRRSFTITDDDRVFWTLEPRAATVLDTYLQE